ncbi:hypothetical protein MMC12_007606, partial [Toensbergia leucococca]|nr:hypothetical protein [Toensbergia leucococca]
MALHGFHGSRSMRHLEAERKTARPPANASKTLSATTASSPASRIPAYTSSWFSRGKPGRGEALTSSAKDTTSSTGSVRKENRLEEPRASRIEPLRHVLPHSTPNLGLGISATRSLSDTRIRPSQIDQRNKLKPQSSSNNQRSQYALSESSSSSYDPTPPRASRADVGSPSGFSDPFPGSILGITVPSIPAPTSYLPRLSPLNPEQSTSSTRMANYTSRQEPRKLSTLDLPPPTPNFAHSSGSSTRYSDSPGPFSRESTPTSASSQSPGITQPSKLPARTRQPSPTRSRPPVTKRRIGGTPRFDETVSTENQGLPPLRESVTSSSSSSTIKGVERTEGNKIRPTRNIVSPPPPNPSLRRLSKKSSGSFLDQGFQPKSGPRESYVEPDPRENITLQHSRPVAPPPRPSREGTPTLDARNRPSPVIQSNLSRLVTTGHKRRESLDKSLTSLDARTEGTRMDRPTLGRSSSISSTSSSVRPSRLPSPIANTVALLRSPSKEPPSLQIDVGRGPIKREASPLSASTPTTRFGLFSRRTQSPLEIAPSDNGQKSTKKGPAAGTGHEGYGRYARRGRSGSASTSAGRGRSTSTGNTSIRAARSSSSRKSSTSQGEPEMDDFLLDRLTPVILTGGGSADGSFSGMDMYRTSSEESSPGIRSMDEIKPKATLVSADPGCLAVNSEPKIKNSMFPLKAHRSLPRAQKDLEHKESSDSSNFRRSSRVPTLAARRSLHQPELSRDSEPMAMPTRINDRVLARSPALDRRDMVQPSIAQTDSKVLPTDDISEGHEGNWLKAKKLDKRPRSPKKWNFFQRSHASPQNQVDDKRRNQQASAKELPAMISRLPDSRSVAHYAMLDSDEPSTLDTVEDLMQDVEDILEFQETGDVGPITKNAKKAEHREHKYSMLLPPPPIFEKQPPNEEAKASLGRPLHQPGDKISDSEPSTTVSKVKQSRLAQVGRIPRVVSKRDHPHKPPPHSFSRPFTRVPVPLDQTPTNITEPEEIVNTQQPTFGVQADVIPSEPWADYNFNQSSNPSLGSNRIFNPTSAEEFFQFPPRKASEVSASSSSGIISIAAITAILPNPDAALSEDEVWTEYDELLDNVESPKVHIAQLAKKHQMSGQTQHKSNMADARAPAPLNIRKKSSDN